MFEVPFFFRCHLVDRVSYFSVSVSVLCQPVIFMILDLTVSVAAGVDVVLGLPVRNNYANSRPTYSILVEY